ncbi:MAG: hypothetical protein RLZZ383_411 [Pseudomonadota bacterium]|jgi:SAM-dependent methyltransferase
MSDWFGRRPARYARVRPAYPDALFDALAAVAPRTGRAWDAATGSGQAAVPLAARFAAVHASDAFPGPLRVAPAVRNITWALEPAERVSLPDASVDVITVAAGLHWFDIPAFLQEVERVWSPGGVLAVWTYGIQPDAPALQDVFAGYRRDVLGDDWSPALEHVATGYAGVALPGRPVEMPAFAATTDLDYEGTLDLLRTWSASEAYWRRTGQDPAQHVARRLASVWHAHVGRLDATWTLRWPLALRVHRRATT